VTLAHAWARHYGYQRLAVEASARAGAPGPLFYEAAGFIARSVIYDIEVQEQRRITPERRESAPRQ
jgi:hypothetical protein